MFTPIYYYSTEDKAVLSAYAEDEMAVARIEALAESFAKRFGAKPLFTTGFDSHFAGITFPQGVPQHHPDLWTKPTQNNPCVVPRSPERAGAKMRHRAECLYKEFHDFWPKEAAEPRVSTLMTMLKLVGRDMSQQLLVYHEVGGIAYLASTLILDLPEITATVFVSAQHVAMSQGASNGRIVQ